MNGLPEWFVYEFIIRKEVPQKNQLYGYYKCSVVSQPLFCYTVWENSRSKGASS